MAVLHIETGSLRERLTDIHARDEVYLSGVIYTARDAAHKRLCGMIAHGEPLPFELDGATIYYAGPTPERPGRVIGSCGPTTSSRMDAFAPILLEHGLVGMIGKGPRDRAVCDAIVKYGGVYFSALGGAGALAAKAVRALEVIAFEELGCESVKRLTVENFPVYCAIDCRGGSMFES